MEPRGSHDSDKEDLQQLPSATMGKPHTMTSVCGLREGIQVTIIIPTRTVRLLLYATRQVSCCMHPTQFRRVCNTRCIARGFTLKLKIAGEGGTGKRRCDVTTQPVVFMVMASLKSIVSSDGGDGSGSSGGHGFVTSRGR